MVDDEDRRVGHRNLEAALGRVHNPGAAEIRVGDLSAGARRSKAHGEKRGSAGMVQNAAHCPDNSRTSPHLSLAQCFVLPCIWLSVDLADIMLAAPARCCLALIVYSQGTMPFSRAVAIFATIAYSLLGIAALLLPETRGRALAS